MVATLQDIRLFVATYEERSLTRAAAREFATQSGVSQHIRKLEKQLGVTLFVRQSGGVLPTPAADRFYPEATEVLRAHARAIRSVEPFSTGTSEEISIGLMPSITRCVLTPALERFVVDFPNARLRVVEGFSGLLTQQVQAGILDFAVVPPSTETSKLRSTMLLRCREILVSRPNSRFGSDRGVRLSESGPLKMIVPSRGNIRRDTLENYFRANHVRIERLLELDAILGGLTLIRQTDWVQVMPGYVFRRSEDAKSYGLHVIHGPDIWLDLMLIEQPSRPMSLAAEAFFQLITDELKVLNAPWAEA